ncbi:hypothetical protein C7M61_003916 [Candidozyma pseudohaemuli]|uniref:RING-type domain-containing protein n=1 Tax=Candidozyma pseudohaemuli TaxID=418784 RepID=A0A2P7YKH5_9ASCO|nr:hypothetical protein C7M61_003916 [[Candida] pseudohaemulonii]PSK36445.1 hypothetical protein C7M61_003916 [[Candida] pseudohaemulonii]
MKFAKVFQQTLIEEEIPDEWAEAAIQYKVLKKCIGRVVKELEFLGLTKSDVKLLLQDESGNESVELLDEETVPNNPVVAKYLLAKSRKSNEVVPFLKISVNDTTIDSNESQRTLELADVIRSKLQRVLDATDEEHQFVEIKEDDDGLTLSPQTSHDEKNIVSVRNNEIVVLLNSDLKFFGMLNTEIENLDQIRKTEEANIIQEISKVSESVLKLTEKKTDLYLWRELFKIYLDSEIFFRYNETSLQQLERTSDMIKQNLEIFSANVAKTNLLEKMARKRSVNTFDRFVAVNERLFKILMFQSINTTALRKILKKFDKQTAFNVSSEFPALISQDHVFIHGSSLAQSICYTIQTTLLVIVPQLDDYSCPICVSIAYKPIRLLCGHLFCVRCLVKMKQRGKMDCPLCRQSRAIASADSSNLDLDAMRTIKMAFPEEVKEKLKEANKERYNEMVGQHKSCAIV